MIKEGNIQLGERLAGLSLKKRRHKWKLQVCVCVKPMSSSMSPSRLLDVDWIFNRSRPHSLYEK